MTPQEIQEMLDDFDFLIMLIDEAKDKTANKREIIDFYAKTLLLKESLED